MAQTDTPQNIDTDRETLSQEEKDLLRSSYERGLEDTRSLDTETVIEKYREYDDEIIAAAEIARAQFDQPFGGMNPKPGRFVVSRITSGYFGWDSWENLGSLTAGATNDWIDEGTPDNLGGTAGFTNPLKVGEEAVHIILGVGTYHDSPKVAAVDYEINESPRTTLKTKYEFTKTDLQVKWLDRTLILPENALFGAQLYADTGGNDFPYFEGLSFIESRASQLVDPSNMTDDSASTQDNIVSRGT